MKMEILQENLVRYLSIANRVITAKPALPILSTILLKATDKNLTLQATNLDTSLLLSLNVKVEEKGKITVPARSFLEFTASLSPQTLLISEEEGKVIVKGETAQAVFQTMNADEFPKFPEVNKEEEFKIKKDILSKFIRKTSFAAALDEGRPVLTGVLLKIEGGILKMVATDGFRLSEAVSKEKIPQVDFGNLIIPAKALVEVERLLSEESEDEITFGRSVDKNQIFFAVNPSDGALLFARLLEAEYPDYKRIIPDSFSLTAKISTEELISAVKTASIFAHGDGQTLKLFFDPQKKEIIISAQTAEIGKGTAKVSADIDGKGIEVGFNAKFLLDGVSSMGTEQTLIQIKEEVAPAMLTPVGDEDYRHIIMPVRLQK